jgi:hypothetical protein
LIEQVRGSNNKNIPAKRIPGRQQRLWQHGSTASMPG